MNKYRQSLDNISSIDLDRVLEKLGYEEADRISVYGMCDYPNIEMTGDIANLLELVNKEEVLEKRVSVLEKALDNACKRLENISFSSSIESVNEYSRIYGKPLFEDEWKQLLLKEVQDGESKK